MDFDTISVQESRVSLDIVSMGCYQNEFRYWVIHNSILGHHFDTRNALQEDTISIQEMRFNNIGYSISIPEVNFHIIVEVSKSPTSTF